MKREKKMFFYFSMMELVLALGLIVFLSGAFYGAAREMRRYRDHLAVRNMAIMVLDNTIERLSMEKYSNCELAREILLDEFSRSELSQNADFRAVCEIRNKGLALEIIAGGHKKIADVNIVLSDIKPAEEAK